MTRRLQLLVLILLAAILISPVARGLVRDTIVIPILYVFWIGRFIFEAIPQLAVWGCFLMVVVLILGIGFLGKRKARSKAMPAPPAYEGQVESWVRLIRQAEQDDYYKWRLAQRLQKLTLQAIANNKGQTMKEMRQQLRQGQLDMPADVEAYLQASLQSLGHLPGRRSFWRPKAKTSPLDMDPIRIVRYLEQLGGNTKPSMEPEEQ